MQAPIGVARLAKASQVEQCISSTFEKNSHQYGILIFLLLEDCECTVTIGERTSKVIPKHREGGPSIIVLCPEGVACRIAAKGFLDGDQLCVRTFQSGQRQLGLHKPQAQTNR